jgi:glutathione synthase
MSARRLAVVMDPITDIKTAKDTTLAMLLAAQRRGFELHYLEMGDLFLRDGVACGHARPLTVYDDPVRWFSLEGRKTARLGDFDAILMRKDPPFDTEYIYATYILERAEDQGALVVNRPRGLRDMNEKVYTAWFPQCCAPTLVTRDMADMHAFVAEHGKAVAKPLHGMGGRSIFVVEHGDKNTAVILETLTDYGSRYAIVQRYLPEIAVTGDARVLVVDGEPVPYALARIPSGDDNRGNLAAGAARSMSATVSSRHRSARASPSKACCSSVSMSSAASSPRSMSRARPVRANSTNNSASTSAHSSSVRSSGVSPPAHERPAGCGRHRGCRRASRHPSGARPARHHPLHRTAAARHPDPRHHLRPPPGVAGHGTDAGCPTRGRHARRNAQRRSRIPRRSRSTRPRYHH